MKQRLYVPSLAVNVTPSCKVAGAKASVALEISVPETPRKTRAKYPLPAEDGETRAWIVKL
jgi:hypothetical protein